MAKQVEIEFFSEGFEQILTSGGVMSAVESATNGIWARANANNTRGGTGFHSGTRIGRAYGTSGHSVSSIRRTGRAPSQRRRTKH